MSKNKDGGPITASHIEIRTVAPDGTVLHTERHGFGGITIRDYFAAQAMAAIITKQAPRSLRNLSKQDALAVAADVTEGVANGA